MDNMTTTEMEYFVISAGKDFKDLSVAGPFTESEATFVASIGIGTIKYITKTVAVIDRTHITPGDLWKKFEKFDDECIWKHNV